MPTIKRPWSCLHLPGYNRKSERSLPLPPQHCQQRHVPRISHRVPQEGRKCVLGLWEFWLCFIQVGSKDTSAKVMSNEIWNVARVVNSIECHCACQVHSVCCCVPFYHTFGCAMGTLAALLHGARQVSPNPHFDPEACLRTMEGERWDEKLSSIMCRIASRMLISLK